MPIVSPWPLRAVVSALYFMVKPEPGAARAGHAITSAFRSRHRLHGGIVAPEQQHVTLHALGEYPELPAELVARACRSGAAVAMEPFEIEFDRAQGWGTEARLLALTGGTNGMRGLRRLQRAVAEAMVDAGLGAQIRRSFRPHVSLLYGDKPLAPEAIEPIRWTVEELLLVESLSGAGVHRVLGRWPLVRRQSTFDW